MDSTIQFLYTCTVIQVLLSTYFSLIKNKSTFFTQKITVHIFLTNIYELFVLVLTARSCCQIVLSSGLAIFSEYTSDDKFFP